MQLLSPNDPRRLGPHRVLARLGHGAMGQVLLGAAPDGRLIALKLIHAGLAEDAEFRARFAREVAASRQVSGAYTAAVLDAGPDDPLPWLASEFLLGPTLLEAVEAAGPLPEEAVLRLAAGLASALAAVHGTGIVHRDLKPGNVILTAEGPRVIDFGIARAAEGAGGDLTRTGGVIGTPAFMSPEQAASRPLTPASDVFSLGSILVMAATGTSPFAAESTLETLNNVVRAAPELDGVPDRVREIAERCLASDPSERPSPARILELVGPVPPAATGWPEAVTALADGRRRELTRLLEGDGQHTTLIDDGATMVASAPPGAPAQAHGLPSGHGPAAAEPPRQRPPAKPIVLTAMIMCTASSLWLARSVFAFLAGLPPLVTVSPDGGQSLPINLAWVIAYLVLVVGTILMWTRRSAGRILSAVGLGSVTAVMLGVEIATLASGDGWVSPLAYLTNLLTLASLVLVLLPAVGEHLASRGSALPAPVGPPAQAPQRR